MTTIIRFARVVFKCGRVFFGNLIITTEVVFTLRRAGDIGVIDMFNYVLSSLRIITIVDRIVRVADVLSVLLDLRDRCAKDSMLRAVVVDRIR